MTAKTTNWYRCDLDRNELKDLARRSDIIPLLWFGTYFLLLIALGIGVFFTWGTAYSWWFVIAYGLVWGIAPSGVHETCHGTPFRTGWLNDLTLWIFGWMSQMEPVSVRWGHAGHHRHTHCDEGDTELSEPNPVTWRCFFGVGLGVSGTIFYWKALVAQAFGRIDPDVRRLMPPAEVPIAVRNARIMVALYGLMIALAVTTQSWLPIVLTFLARIIGGPVTGFLHLTQHTAMQMNIRDHRFSTRSFTAGPITRFFYFNMNHHIEHHMFPIVPFYNLPALRRKIAHQLPVPCKGLWGVYREIIPAIIRQHKEPGYYIQREIPAAAVVSS